MHLFERHHLSFLASSHGQASGEAKYVDDNPILPKLLFGAFVLAGQGNAVLQSMDTSAAKTMPGVVTILTAANLPSALRKHRPAAVLGNVPTDPEPLFVGVGERVMFAGQAIGFVLADTQIHANRAAKVEMMNIWWRFHRRAFTHFFLLFI